jgi:hypothetical protein
MSQCGLLILVIVMWPVRISAMLSVILIYFGSFFSLPRWMLKFATTVFLEIPTDSRVIIIRLYDVCSWNSVVKCSKNQSIDRSPNPRMQISVSLLHACFVVHCRDSRHCHVRWCRGRADGAWQWAGSTVLVHMASLSVVLQRYAPKRLYIQRLGSYIQIKFALLLKISCQFPLFIKYQAFSKLNLIEWNK